MTILQNALDLQLPLGVPSGGTGVATLPANTILLGGDTNPIGTLALTAGNIVIGDALGIPIAGSLVGGKGILISFDGSKNYTISSTRQDYTWNSCDEVTFMIANNGYIANNPLAMISLFLPTSANVGDTFEVTTGSGLWTVVQNDNQQMTFGNQTTTTGTTGGISATQLGDTVKIVCTVANTNFQVVSAIGNIQLN